MDSKDQSPHGERRAQSVHSHKFCPNCPTHSRFVSPYFIPGPDLTGCGLGRSWDKRRSQSCYFDSRKAMEKARRKALLDRPRPLGKAKLMGTWLKGLTTVLAIKYGSQTNLL